MRLCLDEHYPPEIAARLRDRGHDAVAVNDRPELAALADADLWARVIAERRALVTENVRDFMPLVQETVAGGGHHYGIVFSSSKSMPRSRRTIGLFVDRLGELLEAHPHDEAFRDQVTWLQP